MVARPTLPSSCSARQTGGSVLAQADPHPAHIANPPRVLAYVGLHPGLQG